MSLFELLFDAISFLNDPITFLALPALLFGIYFFFFVRNRLKFRNRTSADILHLLFSEHALENHLGRITSNQVRNLRVQLFGSIVLLLFVIALFWLVGYSSRGVLRYIDEISSLAGFLIALVIFMLIAIFVIYSLTFILRLIRDRFLDLRGRRVYMVNCTIHLEKNEVKIFRVEVGLGSWLIRAVDSNGGELTKILGFVPDKVDEELEKVKGLTGDVYFTTHARVILSVGVVSKWAGAAEKDKNVTFGP